MPPPLLDLDPSIESLVFGAVVDVLQSDDVLARTIRTWETLDGTSKVLEPPTTAMMPHLRLLPVPPTMDVAEAAASRIGMHVAVMIATAGLNRDDQFNLWAAFRAALVYTKPFRGTDVFEFLRLQGVEDYKLTQPVFGLFPQPGLTTGSAAQDLFGAARIVLSFLVPR
jgi:hypothetical protein